MKSVDIEEAKTHLSELVEEAANGEPSLIARVGGPMLEVVAFSAPTCQKVQRFGFLDGQIKVPEDFDTMFAKEIEEMFEGSE